MKSTWGGSSRPEGTKGKSACMVIKVAVGNEEFLGENSPPSYKSLFVCKSVDSVMKNALLYGTQEYFVGGKKKNPLPE